MTAGSCGSAALRPGTTPAWLRLVWVKGQYEARPLVERWNSFSRIRVIGDPRSGDEALGLGVQHDAAAGLGRARELHLDIDSYAGTELTAFTATPSAVAHLKYDVTNVAHYLRPDSQRHRRRHRRRPGRAVGAGLQSAARSPALRSTRASSIWSIGRFGDFTGHLDRDPRVRFVNDEARSYLARLQDRVRHHPDLADRHLGGDRKRRVRPDRELALHASKPGGSFWTT